MARRGYRWRDRASGRLVYVSEIQASTGCARWLITVEYADGEKRAMPPRRFWVSYIKGDYIGDNVCG